MQFNHRVSVCSSSGRHLYTVGPDKAREIFEKKLVDVTARRRRQVVQLTLRPIEARPFTSVTSSGAGGTRYFQHERLPESAAAAGRLSGLRAFRHCNKSILPYQADFLKVPLSCGAVEVVETAAQFERRKTCLL
jgi:hypothetical protein